MRLYIILITVLLANYGFSQSYDFIVEEDAPCNLLLMKTNDVEHAENWLLQDLTWVFSNPNFIHIRDNKRTFTVRENQIGSLTYFGVTDAAPNSIATLIDYLEYSKTGCIDSLNIVITNDSLKVWFEQPIEIDDVAILDSFGVLIEAVIYDTSVFVTNPYDDSDIQDSLGVVISEIIDLYDLINSINFDTSQVDTNNLNPLIDQLQAIIDDSIQVWFNQPIDINDVDILDSLGILITSVINDTSVFLTNDSIKVWFERPIEVTSTSIIDSLGQINDELKAINDLITSISFDTSQIDTNDLTPILDSLAAIISELQSLDIDFSPVEDSLGVLIDFIKTDTQSVFLTNDSLVLCGTIEIGGDTFYVNGIDSIISLINSIAFDTSQIDTNDLTGVLNALQSLQDSLGVMISELQTLNVDFTPVEDSLGVLIDVIKNDTQSVFITNDSIVLCGTVEIAADSLTTKGCVFANDHDRISGAAVLNYPANTLHSITFAVVSGNVSVLMNAKSFTYGQGEVVSFTANQCQLLPNAITFTTVSGGDRVNIITLE